MTVEILVGANHIRHATLHRAEDVKHPAGAATSFERERPVSTDAPRL